MTGPPIIVGGCHRSGTSLVRRILDSHPAIHCPPEIKFLLDFHGGNQPDPHAHARFFRTARELVGGEEVLELFGAAFIRMHERAARRAGKSRWADKNPENVLHLQDWDALLGDDWLFVDVVRDPRDVIASMGEAGFPLSDAPDVLRARVDHYVACVGAGEAFRAANPHRSHLVAYEELAGDPEREIHELMEFAGEPFDRRQLRFNDGGRRDGLEDPKVSSTTEVHARGVGRWRRELTPAEAAEVTRLVEAGLGGPAKAGQL